jgi:CBS-domain-containing membrane protein
VIREQVEGSPYSFALVTTEGAVLLGRLRGSVMQDTPDEATAEAAMEAGPTTVRADTPARELLERLAERDSRTAIVTTPEGKLIGVVLRER